MHPRAAEYLMYLINVMFYICQAFVFVSTFFSLTFLVMHGIKINENTYNDLSLQLNVQLNQDHKP